jgi:hypothetical protein
MCSDPITACAGGRANSERVLAIRETDPTAFDEAAQCVAVEIVQGLGGVIDVFELGKHPSV